MIEIVIEDDSTNESFLIVENERHNQKGFCVSRYTLNVSLDEYEWDESYLFYPSLDEAYKAIVKKDYEAGRNAF